MKTLALAARGLAITGPLGSSPRGPTCLASPRRGRVRGPRWVLRCLPGSGAGSLRSLLREDILDLACLRHPSLALPASFGVDPGSGQAFVLRQYVEGADILSAAISRPGDLVPFLTSAAEALAILHRFGIAHGNLKASNLIVPRKALYSRSPEGPRVILCDPAWWPGEASAPSDLRALGAVFYRLLAGRDPEPGEDGFPMPPSELNPEAPLDLERLVMCLLSPSPDRGYRDAPSLIDDLRRVGGRKEARPSPPPEAFLGRREEVARVEAALAAGVAQDGARPRSIAVTGEAGVGKSAFLRRLELEAQLLGYATVSVRCYPEGPAQFSPLRAVLEGLAPAGPRGRAVRARSRRLVEAMEGKAHDAWPPDRRRLVRELLDVLIDASAAGPVLILVDEAHLADSLTVDVLAALARDIGLASGERRLPSLAVAYRTESPFRSALRPLSEALRASGESHASIELRGLPQEAFEAPVEGPREGRPEERRAKPAAAHSKSLARIHQAYLSSLDASAREALEALAVLGRPAFAELLEAVTRGGGGRSRAAPKLPSRLQALVQDGTLAEQGGLYFFQHGSFHSWLLGALAPERKRDLHGRIAAILESSGEAAEEVARHWLESETPGKGLRAALEAARRLSRAHEERRALGYLEAALKLLPRSSVARCRRVARDAAEAYGRIGERRRGIEILEGLLEATGSRREAAWVHARLGVFLHRSGEIARAGTHLEKALALLGEARGAVPERLRIESELAEISSNRGDYARAEAICRRALEALEGAKRARGDAEARREEDVRREEMVLLETLAHLKLRRFEYAEARELFARSLEASEGLDHVPEKSLLLNNLGTLHVQENRLHDAIDCFRRAERLSSSLGDDPSLAAIYSNLAALYAKTGDPDAADEAIRRAAAHDARCESLRTRFVRLHNAGLVDLCLGRYGTGIEAFKEAIALGEELKDAFLTAFDLVYLGECHLFRGEARAAQAAFERALSRGREAPAPLPAMVEARRAVLAALRGDLRGARESSAACLARPAADIPYLDAGNRVFAGWARRLCGQHDGAKAALEEAREFFSRIKVPAGEVHAALELAALEADRGDPECAQRLLQKLRGSFRPGQGALRNPMLSARLLAYETRVLLDGKSPDLQEAAALLVEAEGYLIGRRLRDLESLARELRRRIRALEPQRGRAPSLPAHLGRDPAALAEMADALRGAAEDLVRRLEEHAGEEETQLLRRHLAELEERAQEARRRFEGRDAARGAAFRADSILGESAAARKVVQWIRQVAPTSLPVLITGETGTGKELVARALHGESARSGGPFVSVNCAALPEPLLEAELFGYVQGAFSGAEKDHAGLLRSARGGTFLFDEIGEMPLALQGKILRALDRGRVRPVGATEEVEVDVRHVFATHEDLEAQVEKGAFRQDLFFRLKAFEIRVPALRERIEDLPLLTEHFRSRARDDEEAPAFAEDALRVLAAYPWPGNVRELENAVTHLVLTCAGEIRADDASRLLGRTPEAGLFSPALLRSRRLPALQHALEREYLLELAARHGGDLKATARALGITLRALYARLRRLGIRPREVR
ncbi:MAG: sigma 54-interacting transcriptional regulator [Planctomycetes bacterium]|nr:sigma 54-interacting transcriptional regulator [Planctomycetota bacterium]